MQQYFENRLNYLAAEKANGENPYPHKFSVSISVSEFINKYKSLFNGDHVEDDLVSVAGNDNKILYINFYIKQYIYILSLFNVFFFVLVIGRIMSKRSSSSKLSFYDLNDSCLKVQVMADLRKSELDRDEFAKLHDYAKRGDIVGVTGFPGSFTCD